MKLGLITCNVSHGDEYEPQTRDLHVQSKSVDAVKSQRKRRVSSTQSDTNTQSEVYCPRCGYVKHNNSRCPAINVKCNFCGITGHYARCCRYKAQTRKHQHKAKVKQLVVDTDRDNVSFLGELVMGRKLRSTVPAHPNVLQPKLPNAVHIRQKEVELAKVIQLVVDTDRDNVSFLGELVMGRKLRSTVPAHPNVLQPKLPNAVHIRQKEVELTASSKFNVDRKHIVPRSFPSHRRR